MKATRAILPAILLAGSALAATRMLAQANPQPSQAPAPAARPPSFSAAGAQGSTAPSGYSTGITREETSAVSQGVSSLAPELLKGYVTDWSPQACRLEPSLLSAVQDTPHAYEPNRALGLFYLEHGEFAAGVPYLAAAHSARPADANTLHALVLALLGEQKMPQATELLQTALAGSAQDAVLLRLTGLAHQAAGNSAQAVESYQRAIAASPDSQANLLASGLGLIAAGAPQQASELFSTATARYPQDARLWLGLGIAQEKAGQKPAAVQSLLQATTVDRELAAAYFFLAALADASPPSAVPIRTRLAEFAVAHPSSAEAHYNYALALWLQRRVNLTGTPDAEIESQLKLAIRADPSMARAHYLLGLLYAGANNLPQAEQELSLAVKLEPGNADAHYHLAQDYRKTHDTELAAEETRRFLALRNQGSAESSVMDPALENAGGDFLQFMAVNARCRSLP